MLDPRPETVNSADNLFVYVYVEGGAFLAIPLFLSFFIGLGDVYRKNVEYFEALWVITCAVLGVAMMASAVRGIGRSDIYGDHCCQRLYPSQAAGGIDD